MFERTFFFHIPGTRFLGAPLPIARVPCLPALGVRAAIAPLVVSGEAARVSHPRI